MSLIHGRSPNGTGVTGTNPVLIGGENAAGNASTLTVESGAALVQVVSVTGSKMRQVDSIMGAFAVSTSAVAKTITDKNCTVHILSGNCWINPLATAVADATAIKLLSGMVMDLRVAETLSLISDATGASVQIIVWED